jgi:hypothetical protein
MNFYATILKPSNRLIAINDSDLDQIKRLKQNTEYKFEVVHPRNYQFHKKFYALLNLGFANQDRYEHFEEYRAIKTMQAGFFKMIVTEKGKVFIPESISFSNMDELEFEVVYKKILDIIASEISITSQDIENELLSFM